jgi:hypothetical protein
VIYDIVSWVGCYFSIKQSLALSPEGDDGVLDHPQLFVNILDILQNHCHARAVIYFGVLAEVSTSLFVHLDLDFLNFFSDFDSISFGLLALELCIIPAESVNYSHSQLVDDPGFGHAFSPIHVLGLNGDVEKEQDAHSCACLHVTFSS